MTLLELLVKELPKHGGWPEGANFIAYDKDGQVDSYRYIPVPDSTGLNWKCSSGEGFLSQCIVPACACSDWDSSIVTREQYEAAIASQQPEWNGEGLPPVGIDVEFTLDTDKYSAQGNIPENGQVVNVVAHKQTTCGNSVAVVYWDDRGAGRAAAFIKAAFSPLRTEAERKREDAQCAIGQIMINNRGIGAELFIAGEIYSAIAAGKIPGVEISK